MHLCNRHPNARVSFPRSSRCDRHRKRLQPTQICEIEEQMKAVELLLIGDLFVDLGWSTDIGKASQFPKAFEMFCRMYNRMTSEQRSVLLLLTRQYRWIPPQELSDRFFSAWEKLFLALPKTIATVGIVPLLKRNATRPKSSDHMYVLARGFEARLRYMAEPRDIIFGKSAALIARHITAPQSTALVMVDDYLGSGDTALSALDRVASAFHTQPLFCILTVAAHQSGIDQVTTKGCKVTTDIIFQKSITDSDWPDKSHIHKIALEIGKSLNFATNEALGYRGTEALLTLMRTPNNTLPMYWTNRKINGTVWDSPFTRYTGRGR